MQKRRIQSLLVNHFHFPLSAITNLLCLAVFLQINDQINNTLDRYDAYKKGDYAAAANPIPSQYA